MTKEEEDPKHYDLEERTFDFAQRVRAFVRGLKRTICNIEDGRQLVRASGSVGANYIEANEALSRKDFRMRVRISRKEAKESKYWLRLIDTDGDDLPDAYEKNDALNAEPVDLPEKYLPPNAEIRCSRARRVAARSSFSASASRLLPPPPPRPCSKPRATTWPTSPS